MAFGFVALDCIQAFDTPDHLADSGRSLSFFLLDMDDNGRSHTLCFAEYRVLLDDSKEGTN